jgi:hypothetical protein
VIGNTEPRDDPQNAALPDDPPDGATPDTLVISYGQFKPKGESGMVLSLKHNLPHTLKLDAFINVIKPRAYEQHATSACPVPPKLGGFENWPDVVAPIVLANFRFLPEGSDMRCN